MTQQQEELHGGAPRARGLSEQVDGATGELLGNLPQAFSHVGLMNTAWAIAQAKVGGSAAPATEPLR